MAETKKKAPRSKTNAASRTTGTRRAGYASAARTDDASRAARHGASGDDAGSAAGRALWSGTISFGLVTIPVNLFPAQRSRATGMRMLSEDGTPLARRWCCPKDDRLLDDEEIVRGYEISADRFVVVSDEELESLAPRKSRDIDLRRFVAREEVDPRYFEHGYFLAPATDSTKAYRLLAALMEDTGRAGLATFVMRDKEYLVAILADSGVLSAETLRFADELRSPEAVGLPETKKKPQKASVARVERAIAALSKRGLDLRELEDDYAERLLALAEKKQKKGEDVVEVPEAAEEERAEIVDLMEVLKRSLGAGPARRSGASDRGATSRRAPAKRKPAASGRRRAAGRTPGRVAKSAR
jgi:DNA end-binding protein Ku